MHIIYINNYKNTNYERRHVLEQLFLFNANIAQQNVEYGLLRTIVCNLRQKSHSLK